MLLNSRQQSKSILFETLQVWKEMRATFTNCPFDVNVLLLATSMLMFYYLLLWCQCFILAKQYAIRRCNSANSNRREKEQCLSLNYQPKLTPVKQPSVFGVMACLWFLTFCYNKSATKLWPWCMIHSMQVTLSHLILTNQPPNYSHFECIIYKTYLTLTQEEIFSDFFIADPWNNVSVWLLELFNIFCRG